MSSYHHFYKQLDANARKVFPAVAEAPPVAWDHLISPLELQLPMSVYSNAQNAIQALYRLSRSQKYRSMIEDVYGISAAPAKHNSVLMAYDFHTNEQGECFLIEINTNAAGYLLTSVMELTHKGIEPADFGPLSDLRFSFEEELRLTGVGTPQPRAAITDDDIVGQKMYAEFLMYRDLFRSWGWHADLCEGKDFTYSAGSLLDADLRRVDLVYNRLTDFYLEDPAHSGLLEAFMGGGTCLTPQPREYWLLADKMRLVQMSQPGFLESAGASEEDMQAIRSVLIPTFEKSAWASEDEIWAERRGLFFKPKRAYGGKSVYRGESVSRKVFERLMQEDILIQRFQPAQRVPVDDPRSVLNNWKFDVRFFVYADRIQMAAARIYQGQVTNFSSPMGGFTSVRF